MEDAANDFTVLQHVVVVVAPTRWVAALEDQCGHTRYSAISFTNRVRCCSLSPNVFTAAASGRALVSGLHIAHDLAATPQQHRPSAPLSLSLGCAHGLGPAPCHGAA